MNMKDPYQDYYSNSYTTNESLTINAEGVRVTRAKLSAIHFSSKKTILDVACGVSLLGKTFGSKVYGMDVNPEAGSFARKNGIVFTRGNVENKWNYPNSFFDMVIASHIIEHVINPDHIVLEAKRVLKKGGLLIVCTPNLAAWFNRILLFFGHQPYFTEVSTMDKTLGMKFTRNLTPMRNPLGHLRIFTPSALRDILEFHGFTVIKNTGIEFIAFPLPILVIDRIISRIPSLSSNLIVVGKKK